MIFVMIAIVVLIIVLAKLLENFIEKKQGQKFGEQVGKIQRMTLIAMFSAIAFILMYFDFPLGFAPPFYKLDFSELPVLLGSFILGPVAGVLIEVLKILLKLAVKGTDTALVGEFSNFVIGCSYILPASLIYGLMKDKKGMLLGLVSGKVLMSTAGCFLNAFVVVPKYAEIFGMPLSTIIAMGTKVNKNITDMTTFIAFAVLPFNVFKCIVVSILTMMFYVPFLMIKKQVVKSKS